MHGSGIRIISKTAANNNISSRCIIIIFLWVFVVWLLCLVVNLFKYIFSESLSWRYRVCNNIWLRGSGCRCWLVSTPCCCHSWIHRGLHAMLSILRLWTNFTSFLAMSVWLPCLLNVINISFFFFNYCENLRIIWSSLAMKLCRSFRIEKHRYVFCSAAEISSNTRHSCVAWAYFGWIDSSIVNLIIQSDGSHFIRICTVEIVESTRRSSDFTRIKSTILSYIDSTGDRWTTSRIESVILI